MTRCGDGTGDGRHAWRAETGQGGAERSGYARERGHRSQARHGCGQCGRIRTGSARKRIDRKRCERGRSGRSGTETNCSTIPLHSSPFRSRLSSDDERLVEGKTMRLLKSCGLKPSSPFRDEETKATKSSSSGRRSVDAVERTSRSERGAQASNPRSTDGCAGSKHAEVGELGRGRWRGTRRPRGRRRRR